MALSEISIVDREALFAYGAVVANRFIDELKNALAATEVEVHYEPREIVKFFPAYNSPYGIRKLRSWIEKREVGQIDIEGNYTVTVNQLTDYLYNPLASKKEQTRLKNLKKGK